MKKILLILLLFVSSFLQAQNDSTYQLNPVRQLHNLSDYTFVLPDSLQQYTPENITAGKHDAAFKKYKDAVAGSNIYWLRFEIHADSAISNFLLLFRDNIIYSGYTSQNDSVEVFFTDGEGKFISR